MTEVRARGVIDNAGFDVVLTGRADKPVLGSARVRVLIESAVTDGRKVLAGPTGPVVSVKGTDPGSVLAFLSKHADVTWTDYQPPEVPPQGGSLVR